MARILFFVCVCAIAQTFALNQNVTVKVVSELCNNEPYEPLLFHAGSLWTGRSRGVQGGNDYALELFSPEGKLLDKHALVHTNGGVWAYGPNQVLVMGKNQWPWKSYFSVFTQQNNKIKQVSSKDFGLAIQPEFFAGNPNRLFFNEAGNAKTFEWVRGQPKYLAPTVSGPGKMLLVGDYLFVIERRNITLGDESMLRIDLKTNTADRTFKTYRNHLSHMTSLQNGKYIAVSETLANQILIVDVAKNEIVETLPVPNQPEGVAEYKNCLVTISEIDNHVHFFRIDIGQSKEVDEWDVAQVGNKFGMGRGIAVDPSTGRVYSRSKVIAPQATEVVNSVIVAEDPMGLNKLLCE